MNEKGKEIVETFRWLARDNDSYSNIIYAFTPQQLETFAKLIVNECAHVADKNFNKGFCPTGIHIKQHFGVE